MTIELSAPAFNTTPWIKIPYPLGRRIADAWAGRTDRTLARKHHSGAQHFRSDWLAGITAEFHSLAEAERVKITEKIAGIDHEILLRRKSIQVHQYLAEEATSRLAELKARVLDDTPTNSAERSDSPGSRLARRTREVKNARLKLEAELQSTHQEILTLSGEVTALLIQREGHWDWLLNRVEALSFHYHRRSRTYSRTAMRGGSLLISDPNGLIEVPQWKYPTTN